MKLNIITLGLSLLIFSSCKKEKAVIDYDNKLSSFFQRTFEARVERSPEFQTSLGYKTNMDKWDNRSEKFRLEELQIQKEQLQWIKDSIDFESLNPDSKISYRLFVDKAQDQIDNFKFSLYNYPVNQMFGVHSMVPSLLINMHKIDSIPDAQAYISRIKALPDLFSQLIDELKLREEKGIIPPKFVFSRVIDDCQNIISGYPFVGTDTTTLYEDFVAKITKLELKDSASSALKEQLTTALTMNAKPAYDSLISFLSDQMSRANDEAGVWKFPEGAAFYQTALNQTTTTTLTAEQIHEIGLKEVDRIHGEMKEIMLKVGFEGDLQSFFSYLKEDDQFYYPNTDEAKTLYMDSATTIINNMKAQLDKLFITKPKADMIVKRVEAFREKSAGKAFYQRPSKDGSRPGIYYANLHDSRNMPKFEMEALAYHEGIPGHHMQLSIAQELEGIPEFRKYARYTAFSEGWGLYCEFIPKEMGMYSNPYSDYGRLAMELWRACRLVVDTGIHSKKWTREEGIEYYKNNTSGTERECTRMVERHIVMPSQATAYKIGMMKILELREMAKEKLGEKFDLREYHDVVITNGMIPLDLLEELVNDWIVSKS
ncbi:DUF885 domain-containing protein [Reichenbachiella agarivorans]|uniref:DUF885 domain-containing protein n=1 Tax=Reichenbachiella agarivorans TaxID=2979464 RepID=A0ABY6CRC2_9BACT|nr:DUF885 domain-containing protein [Reichenbachiella agarivorans]UXP33065.1 DUF885 domain-containing protein [Reichenbachiella agarivorans]